jgi:class 3 adenylate cyclase
VHACDDGSVASPDDLPRPLDVIAASLEATGWAAEVCDADWRLVYATSQLRDIVDARDDDAALGIGLHLYFEFIRDFSTAADDVIIEGGGIVGDHVGDGITAFFVVDERSGPSSAARAAIEVGRGLQDSVERAGVGAGLEPGEVLLNIGLHWGATLYMGQVVTGGRLEVTALGDEVNECARIEQTARGGALLASKSLIEHLEPGDAAAVDVAPGRVVYRALGELDGADAKAVRDAGMLAVAGI